VSDDFRENAAMPTPYRIALVQMAMSADPEENLRRAIEFVERAAGQGAGVVCLPELFRTPYLCQREDASLFDLAEPVPGPTTQALQAVAAARGVVLIAPLFERCAPGVYYNSAAIIDADGRLAGLYRKMHIPEDPGYYEKFYFTPGDLDFGAFATRAGKIAALICWDQWFPEGARLAALRGAEVLFYPTAIGWHPHEKEQYGPSQREAWRIVQRGHAIANGLYVAAVNRVGHERPDARSAGIQFWGGSFVCDPQGVVLAEASTDQEEILMAQVDPAHLETIRRHWPFLRDRRIDAYTGLARRFLADPHGQD
jgi:N-carbamoylputrescine amidase